MSDSASHLRKHQPLSLQDEAHTNLPSPMTSSLISFEVLVESVATSGSDTDSLSVMSNDSEDESQLSQIKSINAPQKPRSLFPSYWKKEALSPSQTLHCPASPRAVVCIDLGSEQEEQCKAQEEDFVTYERSLHQVEPCDNSFFRRMPYESRPLANTMRWWGGWFNSAPTFQDSSWNLGVTSRFHKSESALEKRPKRSCLRRSRFAADGDSNFNKDNLGSVTFKAEVEIAQFNPPAETWAEEGWSRFFDYHGV